MSTLVTPDVVEDQAIQVLGDRHREHLAALERQLGLDPQTIEPLRTIDLLVGEGVRLREDKPPVALLGVFGTANQPAPEKNGRLTFLWTLAVQLVVVGQDRRDTIRRRGWYAMTIAACLLQRLPRHADPVDTLALLDVDFSNGRTTESRPRTVGEAQLTFEVRVRDTLGLHDLPPDDSTLPPGSPGGAPAGPYDPPAPWPQVQTATTSTDKERL